MDKIHSFKIKTIRLIGQTACELYMENTENASIKGWIIHCNDALVYKFHEQLNALCQSDNPFISLLQLKQFHKVEVLH